MPEFQAMRYKIEAERLAYWYLRLNGFLTIENFILHQDVGARGGTRTELDLIGLRFPHRREALRHYDDRPEWMEDEPRFSCRKVPFAAFVEVAIGRCKLNGPWTDRDKCNIPRALRALGVFCGEKVELASEKLYKTGRYETTYLECGIISVGCHKDDALSMNMPFVEQITWNEIKEFIFHRFHKYRDIKREHPQWDLDGHLLWRLFEKSKDSSSFSSSLILVTDQSSREKINEYCQSRSVRGSQA